MMEIYGRIFITIMSLDSYTAKQIAGIVKETIEQKAPEKQTDSAEPLEVKDDYIMRIRKKYSSTNMPNL